MTGAGFGVQMALQQGVERVTDCCLALIGGAGTGFVIVSCPESAADGAHGKHIGCLAKGLAHTRQQAQPGGQARFQVCLDLARQNRGRAFGTDGDDDGVAVDDGGSDELAARQIVDNVDDGTVCGGQLQGASVQHGILVRTIGDHAAQRVAGFLRTRDQVQLARIGPCHNLGRGVFRDHRDPRRRLEQQPQLGHRRIATARNEDAAVF